MGKSISADKGGFVETLPVDVWPHLSHVFSLTTDLHTPPKVKRLMFVLNVVKEGYVDSSFSCLRAKRKMRKDRKCEKE